MVTGVVELSLVATSFKVALFVYEFLEIARKFADAPEDSRGMLPI